MKKKIVGIVGLFLNLFGAVLLANSLQIIYCEGVLICDLPSSFSAIKHLYFYGGIGLLIIGFFLQLVERCKEY